MNVLELTKEYLILIGQSALGFIIGMIIMRIIGINKGTKKDIIFTIVALILANILILMHRHI